MKFNDKEISSFAASPASTGCPVDREGYLHKRGESSRQGYKQRWFMLKGNLLFYFKSHLHLGEPLGVIVLERVSVAHSGDTNVSFGFKLEFDGAGTRVYYLSAPTSESRKGWMDALKMASYEWLRTELFSLQQRLVDLTGRDPLREALTACTTPQVPSQEPMSAAASFARSATSSIRKARAVVKEAARAAADAGLGLSQHRRGRSTGASAGPQPHTVSTSEASIAAAGGKMNGDGSSNSVLLELTLACEGLPPRPGTSEQRSAFVHFLVRAPEGLRSEGKTEVIADMSNPKFVTISSLPLPEDMTGYTVEFQVYDQQDILHTHAAAPAAAVVEEEKEEEGNETGDEAAAAAAAANSGTGADEHTSVLIGLVSCVATDLRAPNGANGHHEVRLPICAPISEGGEPLGCSLVVECFSSVWGGESESEGEEVGEQESSAAAAAAAVATAKAEAEAQVAAEARTLEVPSPLLRRKKVGGGAPSRHGPRQRYSTLVRPQSTKQTYVFTTKDMSRLRVTETMTESAFIFTIPDQLLKLFLAEDQSTIRELEALGTLLGPVETARRQRYQQRLSRVQLYQERRAFLDHYTDTTFKPSRLKKDKNLSMCTTNLHVQSIKVVHSKGSERSAPAYYDVVTMGIPAAHCMGFKHGGLRTLLAAREHALQQQLPERDSADSGGTGGDVNGGIGTGGNSSSAASSSSVFSNRQRVLRTVRRLRSVRSELREAQRGIADVLAAIPRVADLLAAYKALDSPLQLLLDLLNSDTIARSIEIATPSRPARSNYDRQIGSSAITHNDLIESITSTYDTLREEVKLFAVSTGGVPDAEAAVLEGLRGAQDLFDVSVETAYLEASECLHILDLMSDAAIPVAHGQDLALRRDMAFSQALTALLTVFVTDFKRRSTDARFLHQISEVGYWVHLSSLLSTAGDEEGMLEDGIQAMCDLQTVRIKFTEVQGGVVDPVLSGSRYAITIELGISASLMERLPANLRAGDAVRVYPIVISQGINEKQTLANKIGDTMLQDQINLENAANLQHLVHNYMAFMRNHYPEDTESMLTVDRLWVAFDHAARAKKGGKNTDLLMIGEEIARKMNAGRLSCCKSGKDRTSMAVTLEQCSLLLREHKMVESLLQQALDAMRATGTRRENVYKNTNEPRYAFNKLQVFYLPKLYRPPANTFGSQIT